MRLAGNGIRKKAFWWDQLIPAVTCCRYRDKVHVINQETLMQNHAVAFILLEAFSEDRFMVMLSLGERWMEERIKATLATEISQSVVRKLLSILFDADLHFGADLRFIARWASVSSWRAVNSASSSPSATSSGSRISYHPPARQKVHCQRRKRWRCNHRC